MRLYKLGAHTKADLKVHLVWIPKYRKRVLTGPVAIRARDLLRQIALEHELEIISGKVSSDHIHMFISYHPTQHISKIVQWLKGISSRMLLSELPHLKKQFWGRHLWARGYLAVSSGNITDEMIQQYIEEQEGEPVVDDSRFPLVFEEGMGSTVKDRDGNVYIDITAGVAVNSVDRRHPRVIKAIQEQLEKLIHAVDITNTRRIQLAQRVVDTAPQGPRNNCISFNDEEKPVCAV
jgi:putative transposase